jgi:hypothetical protein
MWGIDRVSIYKSSYLLTYWLLHHTCPHDCITQRPVDREGRNSHNGYLRSFLHTDILHIANAGRLIIAGHPKTGFL